MYEELAYIHYFYYTYTVLYIYYIQYMSTVITVKIDPKIKKEAQKILKEFGLSMSGVINGYLRQIVRNKKVEFQLRTENGFTVEEEQAILQDVEATIQGYKSGKVKTYASVKDLHRDILAE